MTYPQVFPTVDRTVVDRNMLNQQNERAAPKIPAVELIDAHKHYGRRKRRQCILRGLNMKVEKGEIYGLLGPSGCGKTTLLNIIIGRLLLDMGQVYVFGNIPGDPKSGIPGTRVGYMPQGLALYSEFTIYETLLYFSMLYRLKRKYLNSRIDFLLDLLCLPPSSRYIRSLSGGQQRRVSFAIAMLHEAELLILDEPTVGVDPLLRQSIWRHLMSISRDGNTTVIITTHYVEEATKAHKVGMMRSGRLLAEEEPNLLILQQRASTLEEVFLNLAARDEIIENSKSAVKAKSSSPGSTLLRSSKTSDTEKVTSFRLTSFQRASKNPKYTQEKYDKNGCMPRTNKLPTFHRSVALLMKNSIRIYRNIGFLIFSFMIPTLQVCLFCLAIGGMPKNIPVAVVNEEVPSVKYCTQLEIANFLSCNYLTHINKEYMDLVYFENNETAWEAATRGDVTAILYFNEEFSRSLRARFTSIDVNETVIESSWIRARLDNSDQQTYSLLQSEFLLAYRDFVNEKISTTDLNPQITASPVYFESSIFGQEKTSFTMFMAPGVILSITYFLAMGLTALSTILERKEGLMDRSYLAGVNDFEIMLAHTISHMFIMLAQIALVLICMLLIFEIPAKGSLFLVILLTVLQGLCGMANGLFISSIFDTEETAIQATLGSFYPNLLLSGILWPLSAMPKYLRILSYVLPQTLPCESLRGLLLRGWDLQNIYVWRGFVLTLIWLFIFHLLSGICLHFRR